MLRLIKDRQPPGKPTRSQMLTSPANVSNKKRYLSAASCVAPRQKNQPSRSFLNLTPKILKAKQKNAAYRKCSGYKPRIIIILEQKMFKQTLWGSKRRRHLCLFMPRQGPQKDRWSGSYGYRLKRKTNTTRFKRGNTFFSLLSLFIINLFYACLQINITLKVTSLKNPFACRYKFDELSFSRLSLCLVRYVVYIMVSWYLIR